MHVTFSSTYYGTCCTITTDLNEFTARLNDPFKQMLTAAMARRLSTPTFALPEGVRLQRVTNQATDVSIEVTLAGLSNGYRMDAIERIQAEVKSNIEPAAETFLEMLRLVMGVVAVHEGNGNLSHAALREELQSLRQRVDMHYDRVTDVHDEVRTKTELLSTRLAWVETSLRTLPLIGQRFGPPAKQEDWHAA